MNCILQGLKSMLSLGLYKECSTKFHFHRETVYQNLHLVQAGQFSHVSERLQQVMEEAGGHSHKVLVGLVFVFIDAEQCHHSVRSAVTLQELKTQTMKTFLQELILNSVTLQFTL